MFAYKKKIYSIVAASSGNLVEWFDFNVYAYCALYFAPAFFPDSSPTTQLLNSAAIFAIGFFMRPVGAWWFGKIADRQGRKKSLIIFMIIMCIGSLMIASCPTYASIGYFAPTILLLARLIQGFSVGGEYGTTATYMSEIAHGKHRGFYSSFQYTTMIAGLLLSSTCLSFLESMFTQAEMREWGWRVPFYIAAFASLISLLMRSKMKESISVNERSHEDAGNLNALLTKYSKAFFTVIAITSGGSLSFYTYSIYIQKFLVNSTGLSIPSASHIMTISLLLFLVVQPIYGTISDSYGHRKFIILFGAIGAIVTPPLLLHMQYAPNSSVALLLVIGALAIVSLYTSVAAIVKAEMFPVEVRAVGVGTAYAIGNALFGGTAELIALKLKSIGHESIFYFYVATMLGLTCIVALKTLKAPNYLKANKNTSIDT
jgi:MHS family alpha-ketoglutarate permease-like MFS transporter